MDVKVLVAVDLAADVHLLVAVELAADVQPHVVVPVQLRVLMERGSI